MSGMAPRPRIGTRIRRARERALLTQQQLADAVGVSVRAVNDWENDRAYPRNRIGALESVLGVNLLDDRQKPLISDRLLGDIRRELGDEKAARMIAALEEASADPGFGPLHGQRPVERPDQQRDVFLPGGDPGAVERPGDPYARDDDQVSHAPARD